MAKQLNVSLQFTADTSKAKAQIKDLQKTLESIATNSTKDLPFTKEILSATDAAAKLKVNIQEAFNTDTGKLDLGKFQQSMNASGMTLKDYKQKLSSLGPAGEEAFLKLARSISQADLPLKQTSALLDELKTSLANTARWQISSSALHSFMGAIQSAYGYAQDLNESLNKIQIVTGHSTEYMANFAKQANQAAQALSTTTTKYTDAALIYYQQGLSDKEVQKRTDITIKMANAAGQSAQTVSQQLTAVWNNFAKGGENLEHFADVMTKLGAETASSTSEIATGLEKFAAIADTVGLSYEYAASALATVTATTRQSADVVGTAFKTLFARIQGLNLGQTLEDGVDLNKYSQALEKVGVDVLDAQGHLIEMDKILDQLGSRWGELAEEQRVALAETVAGTRQYSQLMALMENWEFFQQNLTRANNAEGTLEEQAEIYASSWEAAKKRVQAALESIYNNLIDDQFFIKLNNVFAGILKGVNGFINSIGGVKSILFNLSTIIVQVYQKQLGDMFNRIGNNILVMTGSAKRSAQEMQNEANLLASEYSKTNAALTSSYQSLSSNYKTFSEEYRKMNDTERSVFQERLSQNSILLENVKNSSEVEISANNKQAAALENVKNKLEPLRKDYMDVGEAARQSAEEALNAKEKEKEASINNAKEFENEVKQQIESQKNLIKVNQDEQKAIQDNIKVLEESAQKRAKGKREHQEIVKTIEEEKQKYDELKNKEEELNKELEKFQRMGREAAQAVNEEEQEVEELRIALAATDEQYENIESDIKNFGQSMQSLNDQMINGQKFNVLYKDSFSDLGQSGFNAKQVMDEFVKSLQDQFVNLEKLPPEFKNVTKVVQDYKSGLITAEEACQKLQGQQNNLNRGLDSTEEEFIQVTNNLQEYIRNSNLTEGAKARLKAALDRETQALKDNAQAAFNSANDYIALKRAAEEANQEMKNHDIKQKDVGNTISRVVGTLTAMASTVQNVSHMFEIWGDNSKTTAEKIKDIGTNLIPTVTSTGMLITNLLKLPGPLGIILGAVTAIVTVVKILNDKFDFVQKIIDFFDKEGAKERNFQSRLESIIKASDELKDSFEKVKNQYVEIEEEFGNYKSIVDKLNDYEKGSEDWYKQLALVQSATDDLLQKYPTLAKYKKVWDEDLQTFIFTDADVQSAKEELRGQLAAGRLLTGVVQAEIDRDDSVHALEAAQRSNDTKITQLNNFTNKDMPIVFEGIGDNSYPVLRYTSTEGNSALEQIFSGLNDYESLYESFGWKIDTSSFLGKFFMDENNQEAIANFLEAKEGGTNQFFTALYDAYSKEQNVLSKSGNSQGLATDFAKQLGIGYDPDSKEFYFLSDNEQNDNSANVRRNFRTQLRSGLGSYFFIPTTDEDLWDENYSGHSNTGAGISRVSAIKYFTSNNEFLQEQKENTKDSLFLDDIAEIISESLAYGNMSQQYNYGQEYLKALAQLFIDYTANKDEFKIEDENSIDSAILEEYLQFLNPDQTIILQGDSIGYENGEISYKLAGSDEQKTASGAGFEKYMQYKDFFIDEETGNYSADKLEEFLIAPIQEEAKNMVEDLGVEVESEEGEILTEFFLEYLRNEGKTISQSLLQKASKIITDKNLDLKDWADKYTSESGVFKAFNQESASALAESIVGKIDETETVFKELGEHFQYEFITQDLANAFIAQSGILNLGPEGAEAAESYFKAVEEVINSYAGDPEKQKKIAEAFAQIDFSQNDSIDKFNDLLVAYDAFSPSMKDVVDQLKMATYYMTPFETLKDNLAEIGSIVADLHIGDTITKEDYDRLVGYNGELSQYFWLMGNGKYRMIGGEEEVRKGTVEQMFDEGITQVRRGQEAAHSFQTVLDRKEQTEEGKKQQQKYLDIIRAGKIPEGSDVTAEELLQYFLPKGGLNAGAPSLVMKTLFNGDLQTGLDTYRNWVADPEGNADAILAGLSAFVNNYYDNVDKLDSEIIGYEQMIASMANNPKQLANYLVEKYISPETFMQGLTALFTPEEIDSSGLLSDDSLMADIKNAFNEAGSLLGGENGDNFSLDFTSEYIDSALKSYGEINALDSLYSMYGNSFTPEQTKSFNEKIKTAFQQIDNIQDYNKYSNKYGEIIGQDERDLAFTNMFTNMTSFDQFEEIMRFGGEEAAAQAKGKQELISNILGNLINSYDQIIRVRQLNNQYGQEFLTEEDIDTIINTEIIPFIDSLDEYKQMNNRENLNDEQRKQSALQLSKNITNITEYADWLNTFSEQDRADISQQDLFAQILPTLDSVEEFLLAQYYFDEGENGYSPDQLTKIVEQTVPTIMSIDQLLEAKRTFGDALTSDHIAGIANRIIPTIRSLDQYKQFQKLVGDAYTVNEDDMTLLLANILPSITSGSMLKDAIKLFGEALTPDKIKEIINDQILPTINTEKELKELNKILTEMGLEAISLQTLLQSEGGQGNTAGNAGMDLIQRLIDNLSSVSDFLSLIHNSGSNLNKAQINEAVRNIAGSVQTIQELNNIMDSVGEYLDPYTTEMLFNGIASKVTTLSKLFQINSLYGNMLSQDDKITMLTNSLGDIESYTQLEHIMKELNISTNMQTDFLKLWGSEAIKTETDLDELRKIVEKCYLTWDEASPYVAKLIDNIDELNEALEKGQVTWADYSKRYKELDEANNYANVKKEEVKEYAAYLQSVVDETEELSEDILDSDKAADIVARSIMRMNKGVEALAKNFEECRKYLDLYNEETERSSILSEEFYDALKTTRDAIGDLLDMDATSLSDAFFTNAQNLDLMAQAATGSAEAIDALRMAALDDIWVNILADNELMDADGNSEVLESYNALQEALNALGDIKVGTTIDTTDAEEGYSQFIELCNKLIQSAGMSVDQVNDLFDAMGFEVNYATEPIPQEMTGHETITDTYPGESHLIETGTRIVYDQHGNSEPVAKEIPSYMRVTPTITRTYPGKEYTYTGYVDAIAMTTSTDGETKVPKINSVTAKAGGSMNNYSAKNPVGGAPNTGKKSSSPKAAKSPKGSSPKGSSGGKKDTKEKKDFNDELDRYHVILAQIDDQKRKLDELGKAKDRAFGKTKVDNMNKEIKAQKELNNKTQQYIDEIKGYLKLDKDAMSPYGAIFDVDGNITNYEQLMQQQLAIYNAAVDAYNTSAQDEADKERLEAAEKAYELFKERLKQYEETNDLLQEQLVELEDGLQKVYDDVTAKNEYIIDLKLNVNDDDLDFLDYLKGKIDDFNDGINEAAEKLAAIGDETGVLLNRSDIHNEGIDRILGHYLRDGLDKTKADAAELIEKFKTGTLNEDEMNLFAGISEDEMNQLKDYKKELLDDNQKLMENMQEVVDLVNDSFKQISEDLDDAMKDIDRSTEALEHYGNIIDIVGEDFLGVTTDIANALDQAEVDVANEKVAATKTKLDTLKKDYEETEKLYKDALDNNDAILAEKWKNALKEMDDEVNSATEEFHQAWEDALRSAQEALESMLDRVKNDTLDAIAGNVPYSELSDLMDKQEKIDDRFLDEYEQIYEMSKLNRDINNSISDADNIKAKEALRELQKEINKLQEDGNEMSQYDLDNARRKYELKLAELELDNAMNIKDTVRLSKDSEGNWSYIYTADEEKVANAEQNYEDKLYAMQKANEEYINNIEKELAGVHEEMLNKIAEIQADLTLTEEQKAELIQQTYDFYTEQADYYTGELGKAIDNNRELYEIDWTNYSARTRQQKIGEDDLTQYIADNYGYRLGNLDNYITDFNNTMLSDITGFETLEGFEENAKAATDAAVLDMNHAYDQWAENTETTMQLAGTSVNTFAEDMMNDVDQTIVPKAEEAKNAVEELANAANEEFDNLLNQTEQWQNAYSANMQAIIEKNELVIQSINGVNKALSTLSEEEDKSMGEDTTKNISDSANAGAEAASAAAAAAQAGAQQAAANAAQWARVMQVYNLINSGSVGNHDTGRVQNLLNMGYSQQEYSLGQQLINMVYDVGHGGRGMSMDAAKSALGFASGGYTGDWSGANGRLALLHQKELVLNENDTQNFLSAIDMVRQIANSIDLNAKAAEYSLGNLSAAVGMMGASSSVDQTVTITAEFPNVTDRNEIAEALKTLVNEASQYAHRK